MCRIICAVMGSDEMKSELNHDGCGVRRARLKLQWVVPPASRRTNFQKRT